MAFEIFISHASEDKTSFVRPLAAWLDQRGVKVWYDEYVPVAGDSIREKINEGLLQCPYGVVVLSPRFYEKSWPRRKLNGLFSLMTGSTDRRLIPVLLNMSFTELGARDALLLDIKGISAERCVEASGRAIFEAMERDEAAKRHAGLTRYKHAAYSITTTDPPEDVPPSRLSLRAAV